ncbi:HEPN domain-containing protein [Pseudomonas nitroreducens]|uniref:HEPN domain-containing protein n=1 Tax=Pseudomonas nitroreducens TaxID=46680 RepID=UPI0011328E87|nr:HEPN domain-containing protein [Pseudomonas nitroreducens]
MEENEIFEKFKKQYENLEGIISESQKRTVSDPVDDLFSENLNFFIKAYLINICTYLEAFLQELALCRLERIKKLVSDVSIPHNLMIWCTKAEHKEKDLKFEEFKIEKTKSDISDELSGNPYKTINTFKLLGIDIRKNQKFEEHKDVIGSIVTKRNNIIHHNDEASDISLNDLITYIPKFIEYSSGILESILPPKPKNNVEEKAQP